MSRRHRIRAGISIVSKSQCITEIHAISSWNRRRENTVSSCARRVRDGNYDGERGHLRRRCHRRRSRPLQSFVASDETHPRRWSRSASPTPPSATAHTAMWSEGLTSFGLIIREGGQGMHQNWRAWCFGTFRPLRWKVPPYCEIQLGS